MARGPGCGALSTTSVRSSGATSVACQPGEELSPAVPRTLAGDDQRRQGGGARGGVEPCSMTLKTWPFYSTRRSPAPSTAPKQDFDEGSMPTMRQVEVFLRQTAYFFLRFLKAPKACSIARVRNPPHAGAPSSRVKISSTAMLSVRVTTGSTCGASSRRQSPARRAAVPNRYYQGPPSDDFDGTRFFNPGQGIIKPKCGPSAALVRPPEASASFLKCSLLGLGLCTANVDCPRAKCTVSAGN